MRFASILNFLGAVIFGLIACYYAPCVSASDLDIGWNLTVRQCGRLSTGRDAVVIAHGVSAGSGSEGPGISITVNEESPSGLRWASRFTALHIGDEFLIRGSIYHVSSIFVTAPKPVAPYRPGMIGSGCVENDSGASVRDENQKLPVEDEDGIVLPAYLSVGNRPCSLEVSVASLETKDDQTSVVKLEWHEDKNYNGYPGSCRESESTSGSLREMDLLNLPGYGAFRVQSILARSKKHADWVVLVPISGATQISE